MNKSISLISIFLFSCLALSQEVSVPNIIKRAEWGARPVITKETITEEDKLKGAGPVTEYSDYGITIVDYSRFVLHNTNMMYEDKYNDNTDTRGCGVKQAKYIQDYEMDDGDVKADIGYNFVIDRCGNIYEGRSLSYFPSHSGATVESVEQGDITKDPDYGSIGIALISHSDEDLTSEQIDSVKILIIYYMSIYKIDKIITHTEVKCQLEDGSLLGTKLTPKGDYSAFVCPGKGTVNSMLSIRNYFKETFDIPFEESEYLELFN